MPIRYFSDRVEIIDDETGLEITIDILPIEILKPHEETIEEATRKLVNDIKTEGVVRNPIIVDKKTYVILDGMHRYEACRRLKLKYIIAALVNYEDPRVNLNTWIRLLKFRRGVSKEWIYGKTGTLSEMLKPYKDSTPYTITIYFRGKRILHESIHSNPQTKYNVYRILKNFEKSVSKELEITYQIDSIVRENMDMYLSEYDLIIIPPKLEKKDVIEIALQNKVYPPKSTRHIIPARPLNLNIPVSILTMTNEEEVRANVMLLLRSLKVRKVRGEKVDTYRDYDETIYYFYS